MEIPEDSELQVYEVILKYMILKDKKEGRPDHRVQLHPIFDNLPAYISGSGEAFNFGISWLKKMGTITVVTQGFDGCLAYITPKGLKYFDS